MNYADLVTRLNDGVAVRVQEIGGFTYDLEETAAMLKLAADAIEALLAEKATEYAQGLEDAAKIADEWNRANKATNGIAAAIRAKGTGE